MFFRDRHNTKHDLIRSVPGLGTLTKDEVTDVAALLDDIDLADGTVMVPKGGRVWQGWIIVTGPDAGRFVGFGDCFFHRTAREDMTIDGESRVLVAGPGAVASLLSIPTFRVAALGELVASPARVRRVRAAAATA